MDNRLKDSTIFVSLTLMSELGRVKAFEFANVYWPGKYSNNNKASFAGRNFLFKLRKYGYLIAFTRNEFTKQYFVFEVSPLGFEFLNSYKG